jgi:hypothetical protein
VRDVTGVGFRAFEWSALVTVIGKAARGGDRESSQRDEDSFVYHGVVFVVSCR